MSAIAYWNNWTNGIYFIQSRRNLYGIQNYLNSVISNVAFLQTHSVGSGIVTADLPSISIRMALAVIAIIPVLVAYPVSYTHLDVYKRQVKNYPFYCSKILLKP